MTLSKVPSARLVWDSHITSPNQLMPISIKEIEQVYPNPVYNQEDNIFDQPKLINQLRSDIPNQLIQGDNINVMQALLEKGYNQTIDLIYADPPYLSDADYQSRIQVGADKIAVKRAAFKDKWDGGIDSYLDMLYPRLKIMKDLMTVRGSIFIHVDWHVSHYTRLLLDEIFSPDNFINEIVWCYGGGSGTKRHFHRKHDIIFWYGKSGDYIFNPQYRPYSQGTLQRGLTRIKGDKYRLHSQGALMQDWWTDINKILSPTARENLKFPTQKPLDLIKRIVAAASNPNSLVADFFAGSGTMAEACNELGRNWIICDNSNLAVQTSLYRLINIQAKPFKVDTIIQDSDDSMKDAQLILNPVILEKISDNLNIIKISIKSYHPVKEHEGLNSADYLEFWGVDLDFNGVFCADYHIMRPDNRFNSSLPLELIVNLPRRDKYVIAVKVYDIFGDNSMEILELFAP